MIATQSNNPRAARADDLGRLARSLGHEHVLVEPDSGRALHLARALAGPDDLVLATGSFILAGEVREAALGAVSP